jgi:hypothetical protein
MLKPLIKIGTRAITFFEADLIEAQEVAHDRQRFPASQRGHGRTKSRLAKPT